MSGTPVPVVDLRQSATVCDKSATPAAAVDLRQTATVCDTLLRCFPNRLDSVDPLATYSNTRSSTVNLAQEPELRQRKALMVQGNRI